MDKVVKLSKKALTVVAKILIVGVFLFGLLIMFVEISNHTALKRAETFYKQLESVELPQNTSILYGGYQSGSTSPTGNACNYYAMLCVQSTLSEQQLKEHYQKTAFEPAAPLALWVLIPHEDSLQEPQIEVYDITQMGQRSSIEYQEQPLSLEMQAAAPDNCYFIVMVDDGYFTYLPVEEKHRVVI